MTKSRIAHARPRNDQQSSGSRWPQVLLILSHLAWMAA